MSLINTEITFELSEAKAVDLNGFTVSYESFDPDTEFLCILLSGLVVEIVSIRRITSPAAIITSSNRVIATAIVRHIRSEKLHDFLVNFHSKVREARKKRVALNRSNKRWDKNIKILGILFATSDEYYSDFSNLETNEDLMEYVTCFK